MASLSEQLREIQDDGLCDSMQNNLKNFLSSRSVVQSKKVKGNFMRVSKPSKPRAKEVMKPKKTTYSGGKPSRPAPTRKGR